LNQPKNLLTTVVKSNFSRGDTNMPTIVDKEKCDGCGDCVEACPTEAIVIEDEKASVTEECVDCGACIDVCPNEAITEEE
jgi:Fe-S-cluster-containing hydrogenase component 2